jgi:hypothetical protein
VPVVVDRSQALVIVPVAKVPVVGLVVIETIHIVRSVHAVHGAEAKILIARTKAHGSVTEIPVRWLIVAESYQTVIKIEPIRSMRHLSAAPDDLRHIGEVAIPMKSSEISPDKNKFWSLVCMACSCCVSVEALVSRRVHTNFTVRIDQDAILQLTNGTTVPHAGQKGEYGEWVRTNQGQ